MNSYISIFSPREVPPQQKTTAEIPTKNHVSGVIPWIPTIDGGAVTFGVVLKTMVRINGLKVKS